MSMQTSENVDSMLDGKSLRVFARNTASGGEALVRQIFESEGKWLHPLLDFGEALYEGRLPLVETAGETGAVSPGTTGIETIEMYDRITGKAAALILAQLRDVLAERQITLSCHSAIISSLALEYLKNQNIRLSFDKMVPRISCKTEEDYLEIDDAQSAWQSLRVRAGRGHMGKTTQEIHKG